MTKNDWYEAGDQIKNLVQDAIDNKDFSQLSNTISNVADQAMSGLQSALKDSLGTQSAAGKTSQKHAYSSYSNVAADRIRKEMEKAKQQKQAQDKPAQTALTVKKKVPGEGLATAMQWFGYSIGSTCGIGFAVLGIGALFGIANVGWLGTLGVLAAANLGIGVLGSRKKGFAKRFRRYLAMLGERTYCQIEELASTIGQNHKFVCRDLKKMIQMGLFPQGHLDAKETCLITDNATYQQYLTTQKQYDSNAAQAKTSTVQNENAEKEAEKKLSPECRELIAEGKKYIAHIHECNDKIADAAVSEKLDRLETVITRIFTEAEKDPNVVGELKKMMSYYLPTTKKLLDAYCELDAQPIQGQNIESTKKEIEDAIDTINKAFANLLDSLFEDTAWDISSDITVLHTMLAQEGLTESAFAKK